MTTWMLVEVAPDHRGGGRWWAAPGKGYTDTLARAGIYDPTEAEILAGHRDAVRPVADVLAEVFADPDWLRHHPGEFSGPHAPRTLGALLQVELRSIVMPAVMGLLQVIEVAMSTGAGWDAIVQHAAQASSDRDELVELARRSLAALESGVADWLETDTEPDRPQRYACSNCGRVRVGPAPEGDPDLCPCDSARRQLVADLEATLRRLATTAPAPPAGADEGSL